MKKIIILLLYLYSGLLFADKESVVVNKDVDLTSIDRDNLLKIFTKEEKFWPNGTRVTVFVKPLLSIEHKIFLEDILRVSQYRYKVLLNGVVYSGNNTPPIEVSSDEIMITKLMSTPNSIGYINYSTLICNVDNNLKVVKIQ